MLKIFSIAFVITAAAAQDQWYCQMLQSEDCMSHHVDQKCGTDFKTYRNVCELGKAHCKDTNINQFRDGPCTTATITTLSPQAIVHGSQMIFDFQCAYLSHRECGTSSEPICATDGRTYQNSCEYEKARCTHRQLHVAHMGTC